jgi:hypothetical protein
MTWIVVVGSTVVMMLWIVIYSFFMSSDFVDEAIILFGTLTFWTTVLLTGAICLSEFLGQSRFALQLIWFFKRRGSSSSIYPPSTILSTKTSSGRCGLMVT